MLARHLITSSWLGIRLLLTASYWLWWILECHWLLANQWCLLSRGSFFWTGYWLWLVSGRLLHLSSDILLLAIPPSHFHDFIWCCWHQSLFSLRLKNGRVLARESKGPAILRAELSACPFLKGQFLLVRILFYKERKVSCWTNNWLRLWFLGVSLLINIL